MVDRAAALASLLASSPAFAAMAGAQYENFKIQLNGYHATMHNMLVADPTYKETVARLAAGEQIHDIAKWLDGTKIENAGACIDFIKAFIRRFEAWLYPDGAGLNDTDSKMLAEYMSTADVTKVFARAKESSEVFAVFENAIDAAGDVVDPDM